MMDEMNLTNLKVTFTDGATRSFEEGRVLINGWLVVDLEESTEMFPPHAISKIVADPV
jgi:archaellum component FlaF (FlaF/FlaG flagellin family)